MRLAWGIAAGLVLTGCPGTFEGTVDGHSLKVKSSTFSFDVQGSRGVSIVLCPASFAEPELEVTLRFRTVPLDAALPTHGELPIGHVGPLGQAHAEFWFSDDAGVRVGTSADFGNVSLSALSFERAAGSFWLTFGVDDVRGAFDASPVSDNVTTARCE